MVSYLGSELSGRNSPMLTCYIYLLAYPIFDAEFTTFWSLPIRVGSHLWRYGAIKPDLWTSTSV